jgi:hypothetical protein
MPTITTFHTVKGTLTSSCSKVTYHNITYNLTKYFYCCDGMRLSKYLWNWVCEGPAVYDTRLNTDRQCNDTDRGKWMTNGKACHTATFSITNPTKPALRANRVLRGENHTTRSRPQVYLETANIKKCKEKFTLFTSSLGKRHAQQTVPISVRHRNQNVLTSAEKALRRVSTS